MQEGYWTVSMGPSIRTWNCRECRNPIYKDEPMVARGTSVKSLFSQMDARSDFSIIPNAFLEVLIQGHNRIPPFMILGIHPVVLVIKRPRQRVMENGQSYHMVTHPKE